MFMKAKHLPCISALPAFLRGVDGRSMSAVRALLPRPRERSRSHALSYASALHDNIQENVADVRTPDAGLRRLLRSPTIEKKAQSCYVRFVATVSNQVVTNNWCNRVEFRTIPRSVSCAGGKYFLHYL